ncbi:MAG: TRAP transporter small permease subunit [Pseudomonadota bacterium]|nr:TRAP transporter small permease subunit [Pseudomonadota bacterium]
MLTNLQRIANGIDIINDRVGRSVAWLTISMVVVTCVVVVARYLFGAGSIALQESVMYMHGAVVMLAIAFTLKEKGHVRVDVLHERFSEKTRALIDMLGCVFFLLPVSTFIFWTSLDYVSFSWSLSESSAQPGGLPGVYLLKTLIPAMAGLLMIQGFAELVRAFINFQQKAT